MYKLKSLVTLSILLMSFNALSAEVFQSSQTASSTALKDTSVPIGVSVKNFNGISDSDVQSSSSSASGSGSSTPQFGVRDMKVTADKKCKIGSISRDWAGSPCSKIYGPTAPTPYVATSGEAKRPIFINREAPIHEQMPADEDFSSLDLASKRKLYEVNQMDLDAAPASSYTSVREAFY